MPQRTVQSAVAGMGPALREGNAAVRLRSALTRALRLGCVLTAAMALAACGRCGDFLSSLSQDQIAACHSDPPAQ